MDATELKPILDQHELWCNSWGNEGRRARLRHACLRGLDLSHAYLRAADLKQADFTGAKLEGADFGWVRIMSPDERETFQRAVQGLPAEAENEPSDMTTSSVLAARRRENFRRAELMEELSITGTDLRGAIFRDVDLTGAKFMKADLRGADLSGAVCRGACFDEVRFGKTGFFIGRSTNLSRADMKFATGLTQDQVDAATVDPGTRLPEYLTRWQ